MISLGPRVKIAVVATTFSILIAGTAASKTYFLPWLTGRAVDDHALAQDDIDTRLTKVEDQLSAQSLRISTLEEAAEQAAKAPPPSTDAGADEKMLRRIEAAEAKADKASEGVYNLCYVHSIC